MEELYITSKSNKTVMMLASLQTKKGRDTEKLFLIDGEKLSREALGICRIKYAVVLENKYNGSVKEIAENSGGVIIILSEAAFSKISSDRTPDGIILVAVIENETDIKINEKVMLLDCVRDPGNVGTVLRSAAAFGFDRVILNNCADVHNPKTVRASMGALFKISITQISYVSEIVGLLHNQCRRIISCALTDDSAVLGNTKLYPGDCPVIGNEGHGISKEILDACDLTMIIPMTDKTESLNAATAASVIAWEYSKIFER